MQLYAKIILFSLTIIGSINEGMTFDFLTDIIDVPSVTGVGFLNDITNLLSLKSFTEFTQNQLNQMLNVANGNDLKEFGQYLLNNPTGTITKFASTLGVNDFSLLLDNFMRNFNKNYSSEESPMRQLMVLSSVKLINHFNAENHSFELGLNPLADLTKEEFSVRLMSLPEPPRENQNHTAFLNNHRFKRQTLPRSFDWRDHKMVTPVEDQSSCSSCWAFSSAAPIESAWAIQGKGPLKQISKKQMVDCYNNLQCSGGAWPWLVYDFIIKNRNGVINTQDSYPYNVKEKKYECRWTKDIGAKLKSYARIPSGASDETLKNVLYNYGPMSVVINFDAFKLYKRGVIHENVCTGKVNHAAALVGYNTDRNGKDYWIMKNSWGKSWGEDGYVRIARGKNLCDINKYATLPLVN